MQVLRHSRQKVPEKGQATYAPDGVANEIAAVPTLAPQTIPTPVPKDSLESGCLIV